MTDWIHSYTGRKVHPLNPSVDEICIEDIAHALSMICRFTGHVKEFWSVGQHSLLVASLCPPEDRLWGLLHDASEAYIADVSSPLKHLPEFENYRMAEVRLMRVIADKFGLAWNWDRSQMGGAPESVHIADQQALSIEAHRLMGDVREWGLPAPKPIRLQVRPREWVEQTFLAQFHSLMADRRVLA